MPLPKNVTGYRFLDKDPCVDLFRSAMDRTGMTFQQISEKGGPAVETMRAWDLGTTKRPQHLTFRFAMSAMGFSEVYVDKDGGRLDARYTKEALRDDNVVRFRRPV